MPTPLLPEAVPETDANPMSLVWGGGTEGLSTHECVHLLEFGSNYGSKVVTEAHRAQQR